MAYNPQARVQVLEFLEQVGFVIEPGGHATDVLREACGYEGTALTSLLAVLEREGLIQRDIRGKRCYRIGLLPKPAERIVEVERVVEVERIVKEETLAEIDYDHLALEVIAQLTEQLAPRSADPELRQRLARIHEHARALENKVATLTRERDEARDLARATRLEATGLRERLQRAEDNNELLKRQAARGGFVTTEEALDQLIRERPYVGSVRDRD